MAIIDTVTVSLLDSVLAPSSIRKLFTTIVNRRIAELGPLKEDNPEAEQQLRALEDADLIGSASEGEKYYVTAKGLKVARDLDKIPAKP